MLCNNWSLKFKMIVMKREQLGKVEEGMGGNDELSLFLYVW